MTDLKLKVPECIPRNRLTCDNGAIFDKESDVMEYIYTKVEVTHTSKDFSVEKYTDLYIYIDGKESKIDHAYIDGDSMIMITFYVESYGHSISESARCCDLYTRKEWAPEVGKVYGFCDNKENIGNLSKSIVEVLVRIYEDNTDYKYMTEHEIAYVHCFRIKPEILGE